MSTDKKAIVLVSGGLDSLVCASIASQKYKLALLHINYGQRTEKKELTCFKRIAQFYKAKEKLVADISYLIKIKGSSLTDPKISIFAKKKNSVPLTYVPFRNAHLLSIAVSWAEIIGAYFIYIGVNVLDSANYPDTRANFIKIFNKLAKAGTRPQTKIKIVTPIIGMTKKQIVELGKKLDAPFHLSWSCYKNNAVACGRCESCRLRLKGFAKAEIKDPIKYLKGA